MEYVKTILKSWPIFLAFIGYGMIASFLSINDALQPTIMVLDNSGYQNFALVVGAATGFIVPLVAISSYYVLNKYHRVKWFWTIFLLCVLSGFLVGFIGSYMVHVSADSYGLLNGSTGTIIFNSVVAGLFGGCLGWVISIILQDQIDPN